MILVVLPSVIAGACQNTTAESTKVSLEAFLGTYC